MATQIIKAAPLPNSNATFPPGDVAKPVRSNTARPKTVRINVAKGDVVKVEVIDTDFLLILKDGAKLLIKDGALNAAAEPNYKLVFIDGEASGQYFLSQSQVLSGPPSDTSAWGDTLSPATEAQAPAPALESAPAPAPAVAHQPPPEPKPFFSLGTLGSIAAGLAAVAGMAGSKNDSTAGGDTTETGSTVVSLLIVAGPVINKMLVTVYDANGNPLAIGFTESDGTITLTWASGSPAEGLFLVVAKSLDDSPDYVDEATGEQRNLTESLRALVVFTTGSNKSFSITPLTELAVQKAGLAQGETDASSITLDGALASNTLVATLFGITDITGSVTAVIAQDGKNVNSAYSETNGISDSEKYGQVLAKLSGNDAVSGSMSKTLEAYLSLLNNEQLTTTTLQEAVKLELQQGATTFENSGLDISNAITLLTSESVRTLSAPSALSLAAATAYNSEASNPLADSVVNAQDIALNTEFIMAVALPGAARVGDVLSITIPASGSEQAFTFTHTLIAADLYQGYALISFAGTDLRATGDGSKSITAQITGSDGASTQYSAYTLNEGQLLLDATGSSVAITRVSLSADTGSSASDFVTNVNKQTITATLSANLAQGDILYGSLDGGSTWTDITSSVNGTAVSWVGATLVAGSSKSIVFKITDLAGNEGSTTGIQSYTLDLSAVAEPTLSLATDSGTGIGADSDGLTKVATVNVAGLKDGATWEYRVGTDSGEGVVYSSWNTGNTSTFSLSDGTHTYQVRQTSQAGTISTATQSYTFTLDQKAPTATVDSLSFEYGEIVDDFLRTSYNYQSLTGTLSGSLAINESVQVSVDNGLTWQTAVTVVENGTTSWSIEGISISGNNTALARVVDAAGNFSSAKSLGYVFDNVLPTVSGLAITSTTDAVSNYLTAGDNVTVTMTMSEATTVITTDGTPSISLNIGSTIKYAEFSGYAVVNNVIDKTQLLFTYTIESGLTDPDGISIATNAIIPNGGSFADLAGNVRSELSNGPAASSYKVDSKAPTVLTVTITGDSENLYDELNAGDVVYVTVSFSEAILLTGTAQLKLTVGAQEVTATCVGSSNTSDSLVFSYVVTADASDADGITVMNDSLTLLNGAVLVDIAGNPITNSTFSVIGDGNTNANFIVDNVAPTARLNTITWEGDGQSVEGVFTTAVPSQALTGYYTGTLGSGESIQISIDGRTWIDTVLNAATGTWSANITLSGSINGTLSSRTIDAAGNVTAGETSSYSINTSTTSMIEVDTTGFVDGYLTSAEKTAAQTLKVFLPNSGDTPAIVGSTLIVALFDGEDLVKDLYTTTLEQADVTLGYILINTATEFLGFDGLTSNTTYLFKGGLQNPGTDLIYGDAFAFIYDGSVAPATISTTIQTDTGTDSLGISTKTIESAQDPVVTNDTTWTITGTAEAGSTVEIFDGTEKLGSATLSGTAWSFDTGDLSAGLHSLHAKITDIARNVATTDAVTAKVNRAPVIDTSASNLSGGLTENTDTDVSTVGVQMVTTGIINFTDIDAAVGALASEASASVAVRSAILGYTAAGASSNSDLPSGLTASDIQDAFTITRAGAWTYDASTLNLDALSAGDTLTVTYTVVVTDDDAWFVSTQVTVTITGTNDAATFSGDSSASLTETNAAVSASGTLTADDVDSDKNFVVQTDIAGSNGYGKFSINAAGAWTYTADSAHNDFVKDQVYTDVFTVATADGTTHDITVTITGTNDAATFSGDSSASLTETDAAVSTSGTLTAADVDSDKNFVVQTDIAGSNGYGKFSINAAGAWTYTANSAHNEFVKDQVYTDVFTVATADGTTHGITVTITGTNDTPVLTSLDAITLQDTAGVDSQGSLSGTAGTLQASDADLSSGSTLSYGMQDSESTSIEITTSTHGKQVYDRKKAVIVDGVTYGTVYVQSSSGRYVFMPNINGLNLGTTINTNLTFTASDGISVGSVVWGLTLIGAFDTPVLAAVSDDRNVNWVEKNAGVTLSGTADAGKTVTLIWGAYTRTATADNYGAWSLTLASSANELATDGTYAVTATVDAVTTASQSVTVATRMVQSSLSLVTHSGGSMFSSGTSSVAALGMGAISSSYVFFSSTDPSQFGSTSYSSTGASYTSGGSTSQLLGYNLSTGAQMLVSYAGTNTTVGLAKAATYAGSAFSGEYVLFTTVGATNLGTVGGTVNGSVVSATTFTDSSTLVNQLLAYHLPTGVRRLASHSGTSTTVAGTAAVTYNVTTSNGT